MRRPTAMRTHLAEFLRAQRTPPFAGADAVTVVLPSDLAAVDAEDRPILAGLRGLLEGNRAVEAELGAALRFAQEDPGHGARWLIGPQRANPALARLGRAPAPEAELSFDAHARLLISDAPRAAALSETFSLLRGLSRGARAEPPACDCADLDAAIVRVAEEVADTWPAFARRPGLDWGELCDRYAAAVAKSPDPIAEIQAWLAELGDAHTWLRPAEPRGLLSFRACVRRDALVLTEVPPDSAAWAAGARPGFALVGEDVRGGWRRTAASPHQRALVTPLRMLSGPPGELRELRARGPGGAEIRWSEPYGAGWGEPSRRRLPSGAGYLRIPAFVATPRFETSIDEALDEFRGAPGLVVDLRGNPGGRWALADELRSRFVREPTLMGYQQLSEPGGRLGEPTEMWTTPAAPERQWRGRVRFLTDALTYSAAEDALLGLQGLTHVELVGAPSGGGPGQARSLRLLPGFRLTVSSRLSYDRRGHCIEAVGIPVDRPIAIGELGVPDEAALLRAADDW